MARSEWSHQEHLHYMADISDMDCVSTQAFEELKREVAIDVRNLDVAWIILCSKCPNVPLTYHGGAPPATWPCGVPCRPESRNRCQIAHSQERAILDATRKLTRGHVRKPVPLFFSGLSRVLSGQIAHSPA